MDVKKNTLHFRLWSFGNWVAHKTDGTEYQEPPNNLCTYFWQIIGRSILYPALLLFMAVICSWFFIFGIPLLWLGKDPSWSVYFYLGLLPYWSSGLVLGSITYFAANSKKVCSGMGESASVVYEYSKARAKKYCPTLNWVDDEDKVEKDNG